MAAIKISIPKAPAPPRATEPKAPGSARAVGIAAIEHAPSRFHPFAVKPAIVPHWSKH